MVGVDETFNPLQEWAYGGGADSDESSDVDVEAEDPLFNPFLQLQGENQVNYYFHVMFMMMLMLLCGCWAKGNFF